MTSLADATFSFSLTGTLGTVFAVDLLFGVILWPALLVLPFLFRNPSDRLGKRVGLALSPALRYRLNRYLRLRRAVIALGILALSQIFIWSLAVDGGWSGHVLELGLVPAMPWLTFLLASAWPRWRSKGTVHLAHLCALTWRDALTNREWIAVLAAYSASGVLSTWALWHANLAIWSALAVVLLACQALFTCVIAQRVMTAPAVGSDIVELAWDDVLRLERARSLLGSSILGMLFMIAAAGDLAGVTIHSILFNAVFAGALSIAFSVWNRSSAYQNWRRAWPPGALSDPFSR
jgi:hypothetical protein